MTHGRPTHEMRVVSVALEGWLSGLPAACATTDTLYSVAGCRPGMVQVVGPVALTAQAGKAGTQLAGAATWHTVSRKLVQEPLGGGSSSAWPLVSSTALAAWMTGPLQGGQGGVRREEGTAQDSGRFDEHG